MEQTQEEILNGADVVVEQGNSQFYIYRHIRNDTNEVFYVGKGKIFSRKNPYERAYTNRYRNPHWRNIVSKTEFEVEIMMEFEAETEALAKEIEFIQLYGRRDLGTGTLVNLTDGGEGMSGHKQSPEHRLKNSKAKLGKTLSLELREKLSAQRRGVPKSEKHKQAMSAANLGEKNPRSKMTKEIVLAMRKDYELESLKSIDISRKYGFSRAATNAALLKRSWGHI